MILEVIILLISLTNLVAFLFAMYRFEKLVLTPEEQAKITQKVNKLVRKPRGAVFHPTTAEEEKRERNQEFYENIEEAI